MASKKSAQERLYEAAAERRRRIAEQQQQATGWTAPTPGAPRPVLQSYTLPVPTPPPRAEPRRFDEGYLGATYGSQSPRYQNVGPVPPATPPIESEMQALPEPVTPGPPRQVWTPFVDPTRVSKTSSRLPERRLWTGPRGNDVNVGDILPNLQEAWRPLFRPQEVYEELAGGASEEAIETTRQELIEQSRTWNPLKSLPAAVQAFRLRGPAGVGIAGAPEGVIRSFDILRDVTERGLGVAKLETAGIVDPTRLGGRQVGPFIKRLAVNALRAAGFEEKAQEVSDRDPALLTRAVADAIVAKEERGEDASQLRRILEFFEPDGGERVLAEQRQLRLARDLPFRSQWQLSEFTYEGTEPLVSAAQRVLAGDDMETVLQETEADLDTQQRWRDVMLGIVLDPLNVLDIVPIAKLPVVGQVGGGAPVREINWADAARTRMVLAAPDPDAVLEAFRRTQDISEPRLIERIPLFARTNETKAARIAAESTDVLFGLRGHMADNAADALKAIGVDLHPDRALFEVFMNPAADDIAGTGRSADEIKRALGLAGDQLGPSYSATGEVLDMFNSPAAIRTRAVLESFSGKQGQDLIGQWDKVERAWADALGVRGVRPGKRDDLVAAAENEFVTFLNRLEGAARKAVGLPDEPSKLLAARRVLDNIQGVFATYFHMGLSPGWAVRNWTNNNVTLFIDGVDIITPLRRIEDNIRDYDVLGSALSQGGGIGRIGDVGDNIFQRFAKKALLGYRLGQRAERTAGFRAIWHGFKQTMQRYHRLGQSIPLERYDALVRALGDADLAREVLRAVESSWTVKQLDQVIARFEREPWRLIEDEKLLERLRRVDLYDDVDKMLAEVDDLNALPQRFEEYLEAARKRADDTVGLQPPQAGTVDQLVIADTEHAVNDVWRLSPREQDVVLRDINLRIGAQRDARDAAKQYAQMYIDEANDLRAAGSLTNEQIDQLFDLTARFSKVSAQEDLMAGSARTTIDRLRNSLYHQNGLHWQDQPEFAHAVQVAGTGREGRALAWDHYFSLRDEWWTSVRRQSFDAYTEVGQQMAQVLGRDLVEVPAWNDIMVRHGIGTGDWDIFRQVQAVGHEHGIDNIWHLTNHLKKEGLLADDVPVFQPEHITADNYPAIVESLRGRGVREAAERAPDAAALEARIAAIRERMTELNARLAGEGVADEAGEVVTDWERPVVPDPPAFDRQIWWQMEELRVQRAKLTSRWRNELDPDEAARLRAQIDELNQQYRELQRQLRAGAQPQANIVVPSRRRRWPEEPRPRQPLGVSPFEEAVAMLDSDQFAKLNETPGDVQAQWAKFIEQNEMGVDEAVEWLANQLEPPLDVAAPRPARALLPSEEDILRAELNTLGDELQNLLDELDGIDDTARAVGEMGNKPLKVATPPNVHDWSATVRAQTLETERLLNDVLEHAMARSTLPARQLTPQQVRTIEQFVKDVRPRLIETRTIATQVGNEVRDFALHNYADRRNFDTLLGFVYAYPYWYTRTLANFMRRAVQQPGAVAALIKLRQGLRRVNSDLPSWWQDQLTLETPLGAMYLPVLNMLDPLNGFLGDKFYNPDQREHLPGLLISEMGNYGPGVHSWIQLAMFAQAWARGDRDEQLSWMSYLGQPTKGFHAMTVLARAAGADFIPPGGVGIEPWLWRTTSEGPRFEGSIYDARRVMKGLYDLYASGQIEGPNALERMFDAAYWREGELYDQALQWTAQKNAVQVLFSWIAGAGLKARPESEVEIARFDMIRAELWRRRPGGGAIDEMTREQQRLAYQELSERYPWGDAVIMGRKDEMERDDRMVWSVFNRLPPNNDAYLDAVGLDPRLLDMFYTEGLEAMPPTARKEFVGKMQQLYAILALPADATVQEWNEAKNASYAMKATLAREFGDAEGDLDNIYELQNTYFDISDPEAAAEFLNQHAILAEYWDRRRELIMADPLLQKYMASMDMFERVARDDFNRRMDAKYPNLDVNAFWDEYWGLREVGLYEQADAMWDEYPEMNAYLRDKNLWTLQLREELEAMAAPIEALSPEWARLRADADLQTPGQMDVADLIKSGSRPMGGFELPEDLEAEEVKAALELEKASLQGREMWGIMYGALAKMGGLDDTLRAYNEWKDIGTIQMHLPELKALLVAMETVRTENGWAYAGDRTAAPSRAGTRTSDGFGSGSGSGGGRGGGDPYTLTNYAAGATDVAQYVKILQTERWATNEVKDIEAYLNDVLADGTWQTRSLMNLSADTQRMMQDFLNATAGAEIDPAAVRAYLESAVVGNDPMAGLGALPPEIQQAAAALGTAFLAEFNERLGGGSSGGGGQRSGGRVRSSRYGGASEEPVNDKQKIERQAQVHTFLTTLRRRSPAFWAYLRDLSRMTAEEAAAFLSDPKYRHFKNWLIRSVFPTFGPQIKDIIEYFKSPPTLGERQRYNNYVRSGASQRFSQRYTA